MNEEKNQTRRGNVKEITIIKSINNKTQIFMKWSRVNIKKQTDSVFVCIETETEITFSQMAKKQR